MGTSVTENKLKFDGNAKFQGPDDGKIKNPLLIPEIIASITSHLGIVDLQKYRSISKVWNSEALKALQKHKSRTFCSKQEVHEYIKNLKTRPDSLLKFEMKHQQLHTKAPMIKFYTRWGSHIQLMDISICFRSYPHYLFKILAENLTNLERFSLKIYPEEKDVFCRERFPFNSFENDNHPEEPLSPCFLNLKEFRLAIDIDIKDVGNKGKDFPVQSTLKKLLSIMPTLEKLSFPLSSEDSNETLRLPQCFVELLELSRNDLVSYGVDNQLYLCNESLQILAGRSNAFRYLDVKVDNSTKLVLFLLKCPNLQTLKIQFPNDCLAIPEPISMQMNYLQHLTITNFKGSVDQFAQFKSLRTLTINKAQFVPDGSQSAKISKPFIFDINHWEGCENELVTFITTNSIANNCLMSSLTRSFPKLKILKVDGLDDDGLEMIYQNLLYLEELEIINGKCTDQGLTGIEMEKIKDYKIFGTDAFVCLEGQSNCLSRFRTRLYITALEKLKTLKICSDEISDISILYGIVDCKQLELEHLTLVSFQVTDEGIRALNNDLDRRLKSLEISGCSKVSSEMKTSVELLQNCHITNNI